MVEIKEYKGKEYKGKEYRGKKYKGILVVAEGGDASGSGTVIAALENWAIQKKLTVFNLVNHWARHNNYPLYEDIKNCDVVIAREPSNIWIGACIRNELIRKDKDYTYSAMTTAMAYSIDRELLYKRLLGSALKHGKIVFSERSFISSIVYQPLHARLFTNEKLSVSDILGLPGNKYVFENYCPDLVFIQQSTASEIIKRLKTRVKQDNCAYEQEMFQAEIVKGYCSGWLKSLLESKAAKLHYIDTLKTKSPEKTGANAVHVWERFYDKQKPGSSLDLSKRI